MIRRLDAMTGEPIWSWVYKDNRMNVDVLKARNGALFIAYSHAEAIKCKLTKLTDSAWITEIPTAVSKTRLSQEISVRPNPTTGKVLIESPDVPVSTIRVSDALGKQISLQQVEQSLNGIVEVDLSDCPQGVYFLNLVLENNTWQTGKIIRQ